MILFTSSPWPWVPDAPMIIGVDETLAGDVETWRLADLAVLAGPVTGEGQAPVYWRDILRHRR